MVTTGLEPGLPRAGLILGVLDAAAGAEPAFLALDHGRAFSRTQLEKLRRGIEGGVAGRTDTRIFTSSESQPRVVSCGRAPRPLRIEVLEPLTFFARSVLLVRPRTEDPIDAFHSIAFADEPSFSAVGITAALKQFEAAGRIFESDRTVLYVVGSRTCCQDAFDAATRLGAQGVEGTSIHRT